MVKIIWPGAKISVKNDNEIGFGQAKSMPEVSCLFHVAPVGANDIFKPKLCRKLFHLGLISVVENPDSQLSWPRHLAREVVSIPQDVEVLAATWQINIDTRMHSKL